MEATDIKRPVDPRIWGKDHWSTFAYVETTAVDKQPLDLARMRCDTSRHPLLMGGRIGQGDGTRYPTRLSNGSEIADHDDWDCLWDAKKAGLLRITGIPQQERVFEIEPGRRGPIIPSAARRPSGGGYQWNGTPRVALTPLGWRVAAELREHKGRGGSFGTFRWPTEDGQKE